MNHGKPISNPMLCGTIELMKAENTPEHRKMFMDEMIRATYISPVVITPQPQPDANGMIKLTPENKIQFPMITTKEDKKFFVAFTDGEELKKWKTEGEQQTLALKFDDYAGMLFRKDKEGNSSPALGFVINPFSSNILITKEMVAQIMATRMIKSGMVPPEMKKEAEEQAEE